MKLPRLRHKKWHAESPTKNHTVFLKANHWGFEQQKRILKEFEWYKTSTKYNAYFFEIPEDFVDEEFESKEDGRFGVPSYVANETAKCSRHVIYARYRFMWRRSRQPDCSKDTRLLLLR